VQPPRGVLKIRSFFRRLPLESPAFSLLQKAPTGTGFAYMLKVRMRGVARGEAEPALKNDSGTIIPIRYESGNGEMMVYGGSLLGLFLLSLAVTRFDGILLLAAIAAFGVAYYYAPLTFRRHPPLQVSPEGFYIEGLGLLPWSKIAGIRIYNKAVRNIRNAELYLILHAPIEKAVVREREPESWRRYMYSVWKPVSEGELTVKLEPLAVSPEQLGDVIRARIAEARKADRA